jgi:anti-sigma factor RsiW
MCDVSEKLIAWLDHELPENEAADLGRHLQGCAECRNRLDGYSEVNNAIVAYCDAVMASRVRHGLPRWVPVLSAVAAAVTLLVLFPRGHVDTRPPQPPVATTSPAVVQPTPVQPEERAVLDPSPAPINRRARTRQVVWPRQGRMPSSLPSQNANLVSAEPAIQIAIPAEAMFAPGAVPQGVSFTAELSIAPDGSAQQLRLRP